ncbi:hypothetical protein QFZ22_002002 [Streptomyces canus]|uniref:Uncharacterized protein n=1 Tax=Streptomyces canus TaxID=58343 RepID=A0AAW8F7D3_9ACTN|nr:hypothetical protein [Streptomyces canus]MDQ0906017.1 hypothetical protein [Streptomyces canus]
MITGEIKGKVDRVWDAFRSGGISNPLDVTEQITRLFFTEDRQEPRRQRARGHSLRRRGQRLVAFPPRRQGDEVVPQRPTLRTADKKVTAGQPDAVGV